MPPPLLVRPVATMGGTWCCSGGGCSGIAVGRPPPLLLPSLPAFLLLLPGPAGCSVAGGGCCRCSAAWESGGAGSWTFLVAGCWLPTSELAPPLLIGGGAWAVGGLGPLGTEVLEGGAAAMGSGGAEPPES